MGDRGVTNVSDVTSRMKNITKERSLSCKIIELIFCIVTIGLIVDPFRSVDIRPSLDHVGFVYVSICGYILINAIIILCYFIGERLPKRMSMIFSSVGGILSFASGVILIHNWSNDTLTYRYYEQYSNQLIASGIFSLMASIVFVIDAILTNKYD